MQSFRRRRAIRFRKEMIARHQVADVSGRLRPIHLGLLDLWDI